MVEVAPSSLAAPARAPAKRSAKPKKAGPSVGALVVKAVTASKDKKGVSLPALKKALAAGGYDVEKNNARVKVAVKSLVSKGTLVQTKGIGASGSFKLAKKPVVAKKKPVKKAKKPAAKAAKKPAAKRPAAAKKPKKTAAKKKPATAKKSPKKAAAKKRVAPKKATKSPKKAKKPAKAKAPKKAKPAKAPKKAAPKKK
ncbi:histone H1-like [Engraulis encrasicolus]|uniref:histone H1-like n=1 Tax=Engraulis encrasicolus TaxID=184585 RepID=UPI002FD46CFD